MESFLVRASDTGIYWAISVARELVPAGTRDPEVILEHFQPRLDGAFRAVTSATAELRYDELIDCDPIAFWGRGAVTLLGDAAHPMLTHTGQGAAQATVAAVACGLREVVVRSIPVKPLVKLFARINRRAGTDIGRG